MDEVLEGPLGREMVFRFIGGPVDGSELSSHERAETNLLWVLTRCGTIGQEYWLVTPSLATRPERKQCLQLDDSVRRHRYRVVTREDSEGQVAVTSVFVRTGLS